MPHTKEVTKHRRADKGSFDGSPKPADSASASAMATFDSPAWTLDALALDKAIIAAREELAALKRERFLHDYVQRLQEKLRVRNRLYELEVQRAHCSNADDSDGQ